MPSAKISLMFSDGVSLGDGHCKVIVDPVFEGFSEDIPNSVILDWSAEKGASGLDVDYPLSSIAIGPDRDSGVVLAGRLGYIGIVTDGSILEETIEGPISQGFITDVRTIGEHVYAVGMGRQVYKRSGSRHWQTFEQGMDKSADESLIVTGLNAIDGFSESEMYAVGFEGEIWRYTSELWSRVESPTNVILECIRVSETGQAFAAGQAGTILRGRGNKWEAIAQSETQDDFWDLEWFMGKLYLATAEGVFTLTEDDQLQLIDLQLPGPRTYSRLDAGSGALWSFGPSHLSWTIDGKTWNDVTWNPR